MSSNELIEVYVEFKYIASGAYQVSDGENETWLPKPLLNLDEIEPVQVGDFRDIEVPEWLLIRGGLI